MNSIGIDTLNAIDLFTDNCDNSPVIIHIPHSSTYIPIIDNYVSEIDTMLENIKLVDKHTSIFNVDNITKLVTPFSRIFCDVERFEDENEPMFKIGQGFYYTHTSNGDLLRTENEILKKLIYKNYYLKHHEQLTALVENKLNRFNKAIIFDCHTFSGKAINVENLPEICIGTDVYHTSPELELRVKAIFCNYEVAINNPYSGTIVPKKYYKTNPNVSSIMIEVNQDMCNAENINRLLEINQLFKSLVYSFKQF